MRGRLALVILLVLVAGVLVLVATVRSSRSRGPRAPAAMSARPRTTPTQAHGSQPSAARSLAPTPSPAGRPPATAQIRSAPPVAPLAVTPPRRLSPRWRTAALVEGRPATWVAERSGVTFMRFDQSLIRVDLHAGSSDGGVGGWRYGDRIGPSEVHRVVAAVNGGFRLSYGGVGFVSGHHVAVALKPGLASIVTYSDGTTNIGAWEEGVPSARRSVFSVLQNEHLLIDHGVAAASVAGCVISCWGATIGGSTEVARSALGITADGQLVWAAGERLLPAQLAAAIIAAGAVRAIELDINPDWVAGYLYVHRPSGPAAVPLVPGQIGIAGQLLEPYSRDFLAMVAA